MSKHQITITVSGKAGVGKSTVIAYMLSALRAMGFDMVEVQDDDPYIQPYDADEGPTGLEVEEMLTRRRESIVQHSKVKLVEVGTTSAPRYFGKPGFDPIELGC